MNVTNYAGAIRLEAAKLADDIKTRFEPTLRRWAAAQRKSELRDIEVELAALQAGKLPTTPATKRMLGALALYKAFGKVAVRQNVKEDEIVRKADGSIDIVPLIDIEKTQKALVDLHFNDGDFATFCQEYSNFYNAIVSDVRTDGEDEVALITKFKKPLRPSIIAQLEEAKANNKQLFDNLEKDLGIKLPLSVLDQDLRRLDAMLAFVKSTTGVPLPLVKVSLDEGKSGKVATDLFRRVGAPDALSERFSKRDWKEFIPVIVAGLKKKKAELKSKDFEKKVNEAVDNCLSDISLAAASYPTKKKRDALLADLNKSSDKLMGSFKGVLSEHTAATWKQTMSTVDIVVPPTQEDWLKFAKTFFNDKTSESERDDTDEQKEVAKALPDYYWWDVADVIYQDKADEKNADKNGMTEACTFFKIEAPFRDYNLTGFDTIVLSSSTVWSPKAGLGVAAHEMGHSLSRLFRSGRASAHSSMWFVGVKECLGDWHPESGEYPKPAKPGLKEYPYVEEDFADAVASKLGENGVTMACSLSKSVLNHYYDTLTDDGITPPILRNRSETDTHSSYTFRALHAYWAAHKDLPPECKASLKRSGLGESLTSCF